jgi:hypothetical protein
LFTPTKAISLYHKNARFEADALRIDGERVDLPSTIVHSGGNPEPGTIKVVARQDVGRRELTIDWPDGSVQSRMQLVFGGDATHWWVDRLTIVDGAGGRWVYPGPLFRTRKFELYEGDADLQSRPAADGSRRRLRMEGLRLTPFGLALQNRPSDGCTRPAGFDPDLDLLAEDQPLSRSDLVGLTARAAHELLEAYGLCHYFWVTSYWTVTYDAEGRMRSGSGTREIWCVPPPDAYIVSRVLPPGGPDVVRIMAGDPNEVLMQRWTPLHGVGCEPAGG